jgi:hypothetical protein
MLSQAITNLLVLEVANWLSFSFRMEFRSISCYGTFIHVCLRICSALIPSSFYSLHTKIDWMNQQKKDFFLCPPFLHSRFMSSYHTIIIFGIQVVRIVRDYSSRVDGEWKRNE